MKLIATALALTLIAPATSAQEFDVEIIGYGKTEQFFEPLSGDLMVTDSRSRFEEFENLEGTPLEGMTGRCFGNATILRGVPRGNGNCVFTDPEGAKVLQAWSLDEVGQGRSAGTWHFVGGTGKHEGVTGRGHFVRLTNNTAGTTETRIYGTARWPE